MVVFKKRVIGGKVQQIRANFSSGTSKSLHPLPDMLDFRRRGEAMADETAPVLELGRVSEPDGVILDRLPGDEQPIAARPFDGAPQFHPAAALRALENRRSLFHG